MGDFPHEGQTQPLEFTKRCAGSILASWKRMSPTHRLPFTALLLLALAALVPQLGCAAGDDSVVERIPSDEDDRLDQRGVVCESSYDLSGSFVASSSPSVESEGECWPVGEWRIAATLTREGCSPQESFGGQRVYEVTVNADEEYEYRFPADPANQRIELGVISHGGPDCEGQFDHFDRDNSVWNLRPVLAPDGAIAGTATYTMWPEDQFDGESQQP